jgi:hypothetical protein
MTAALEEIILRELQERGCRSVHYWGGQQGSILRALVNAKQFPVSYSASAESFEDPIIRPAWMANIRFLKEGYPKADAWIVNVPDVLATVRKDRERIRRKVRKMLLLVNLHRSRFRLRGFKFVEKASIWIGTPIPLPPLHHSVYVIELDPVVASAKRVAKLNPDRDPSKSCLYVGMTGLPVEQRFENHKRGYKDSAQVLRHGIQLRPEFYDGLNPMSQRRAAWTEKKLANDLRGQGYTVVGGTRSAITFDRPAVPGIRLSPFRA